MWCIYNDHCLDIVIIIRCSINYPRVFCLPTVCYFLREATSEIYGSRVYSLLYLLSDLLFAFEIYFYLLLCSDLLFQKPQNTLLHFLLFILFRVLSRAYYPIYHNFYPINLTISGTVTKRGIDNPSYASGCKYLFFVCRYRLHSVAWFSYWIDTLVS